MGFADHLERFYPATAPAHIAPRRAGVDERLPGFRVLPVAPSQAGEPWVYATCGAAQSAVDGEGGAEYVLLAPEQDAVLVEMLATLALANADAEEKFGVGSLIALGRPWLTGSWAKYLLVLPPYPFAAGFEIYEAGERSTVVLWLVPILTAEAQYVRERGHQALEQIIETRKANVADPRRASVV